MIQETGKTKAFLQGLLTAAIVLTGFVVALSLQPTLAFAQSSDPQATPTPDRLLLLAEPTLPADPGQADLGSQAYWLHCMPCHGQNGQGLTNEFRNLYPPEDQNCWNSGCHGNRPYESGFTLPRTVPALIGPGALQRFETAGNLFGYMDAAMPFQAPGSLNGETYWQITSYLVRANGKPVPEALGPENSMAFYLQPTRTPEPPLTPTPMSTAYDDIGGPRTGAPASFLVMGIAILLLGAGAALWLVRRVRG